MSLIALTAVWLTLLVVLSFGRLKPQVAPSQKPPVSKPSQVKVAPTRPQVVTKSAAEKEAIMAQDMPIMNAYGLYYDYANLSLEQAVRAYLTEFGISPDQVAFSYKNTVTGERFGMNETQPMTAGSTYKLPLNMLIVDGVEAGKFSMTAAYDITQSGYEYIGEHQAYLDQFGPDMTISEMQEYSLLHSENTPAYAMAQMLGGLPKAYDQFTRYGKANGGAIPSISLVGNQTTTDYYIQVLDHLYQHQERYKDILYYLGESFPGDFAKIYLPNLTIYQKPGYYAEALNVDAIVMEEQPYLVAIYTAYLGDASPDNPQISTSGVWQVAQLTYVINQWHRVNRNN